MKEKIKVIIDTDPGVDDATALMLVLNDENIDVKLITTTPGNIDINTATRNMLHLLDILNLDIPVAKGNDSAMYRASKDASFLHGKEGLGSYVPPKTTRHKVIEESSVDAMYRVICENPNEITLLEYGPHTNIGLLFKKYPDAKTKLKQIIFEGGSPYNMKHIKPHISFNISSDPESFKFTVDSHVPTTMVPSYAGREMGHFTEKQVEALGIIDNDIANFLCQTYQIYWEPKASDKRIATNDTCCYMYLVHPEIFKIKKSIVDVDLTYMPGKTYVYYNKNGRLDFIYKLNRKKYQKIIFDKINKLKDIQLPDSVRKRLTLIPKYQDKTVKN